MTIANRYLLDTGETVGQAVRAMHAEGKTIEQAARIIGYRTSSDLRKHLRHRAIDCPWDKKHDGRGKPPIVVTDSAMEYYAKARACGMSATEAARHVGFTPQQLQSAIYGRRPDLRTLEPIRIKSSYRWTDSTGKRCCRKRTFATLIEPGETRADACARLQIKRKEWLAQQRR